MIPNLPVFAQRSRSWASLLFAPLDLAGCRLEGLCGTRFIFSRYSVRPWQPPPFTLRPRFDAFMTGRFVSPKTATQKCFGEFLEGWGWIRNGTTIVPRPIKRNIQPYTPKVGRSQARGIGRLPGRPKSSPARPDGCTDLPVRCVAIGPMTLR